MHSKGKTVIRVLFWSVLLASYILAILPQQDVPQLTPFNDKGNHLLALSVLTLLLLQSYRLKYTTVFLRMFLYGVWIEVSQLFAVNRQGEVLDVVADSMGVVVGIVLFWVIEKYRS